jgi:hypothetical protein
MGLTVGVCWLGLRICRVGVAMMAIAGVGGHNPVGACPQNATELLRGYKCVTIGCRGRPQGINWLSEQHDWVVGVGRIFSSRRGSTGKFPTSCEQIKSDLIEQYL